VREIGDEPLILVEHLRADGDGQHDVLPALAAREPPAAAAAALRTDLLVRPERREVAPLRVRDEHDVAARAAVTAVRPAFRHELLAPKVDRAVAAAACSNVKPCSIVEHHQTLGAEQARGSKDRANAER
jgi:hypothetical protein